jgi:hypothetical protein
MFWVRRESLPIKRTLPATAVSPRALSALRRRLFLKHQDYQSERGAVSIQGKLFRSFRRDTEAMQNCSREQVAGDLLRRD